MVSESIKKNIKGIARAGLFWGLAYGSFKAFNSYILPDFNLDGLVEHYTKSTLDYLAPVAASAWSYHTLEKKVDEPITKYIAQTATLVSGLGILDSLSNFPHTRTLDGIRVGIYSLTALTPNPVKIPQRVISLSKSEGVKKALSVSWSGIEKTVKGTWKASKYASTKGWSVTKYAVKKTYDFSQWANKKAEEVNNNYLNPLEDWTNKLAIKGLKATGKGIGKGIYNAGKHPGIGIWKATQYTGKELWNATKYTGKGIKEGSPYVARITGKCFHKVKNGASKAGISTYNTAIKSYKKIRKRAENKRRRIKAYKRLKNIRKINRINEENETKYIEEERFNGMKKFNNPHKDKVISQNNPHPELMWHKYEEYEENDPAYNHFIMKQTQ